MSEGATTSPPPFDETEGAVKFEIWTPTLTGLGELRMLQNKYNILRNFTCVCIKRLKRPVSKLVLKSRIKIELRRACIRYQKHTQLAEHTRNGIPEGSCERWPLAAHSFKWVPRFGENHIAQTHPPQQAKHEVN